MAITVSQAPVAFMGQATGAATTEQIINYNTAGVSAGHSGVVYLDSPSANLLGGRFFTVKLGGTIVAHGATQTVKIGLVWYPWVAGGTRSSTAADTFTLTSASAALTSGTSYDFALQQTFYAATGASTVVAFAPSFYWIGAALVVAGTVTAPLATVYSVAPQTEPITGINNTVNFPCVSFAASITNSVADTTETFTVTEFLLET